jgi:cystine transport system ATP-binding protein
MIKLENIEKFFGEHRVLSSVDLTLASGNVTALIGPSGSGKSTLLRCVNLLEIPEGGSLELGDQRLEFSRKHKPARDAVLTIRRRTGMVFQNFQLFPHLTVLQNVMEGLLTVQKWDKARARERAHELLTKVGIAHKADAWPATLSGGHNSGLRLHGHWRRRRRSYCATSQPRRSIRGWRPKWSKCSSSSPAKA